MPEYQPPFEFTGRIYSVTVDVSGQLIEDKEAEVQMLLARSSKNNVSISGLERDCAGSPVRHG